MGGVALKLLEGMFQGSHEGQNPDRRGKGGILVAAAKNIDLAKNNCALLIL